jgi:hypothetical protein
LISDSVTNSVHLRRGIFVLPLSTKVSLLMRMPQICYKEFSYLVNQISHHSKGTKPNSSTNTCPSFIIQSRYVFI